MRIQYQSLTVVFAFILATGCATYPTETVKSTDLVHAQADIPEQQLLDVTIEIFDDGLPSEDEALEEGVYPEVRKSESRFIPLHLKHTLENSKQWGRVQVIPQATYAADVLVKGRIVASDGEKLIVNIEVLDATERVWLRKEYEAKVVENDYEDGEISGIEPFQDLYNTIANDMLAVRKKLNANDINAVRLVSELRFAAEFAPYAFNDYLQKQENGTFWINRLPAKNDPLLVQVQRLRQREDMFIDTLNGHYTNFYDQMVEPYISWRRHSHNETVMHRQLKRDARLRMALGAALFVAAILVNGNLLAMRDLMIAGGAVTFTSGLDRNRDAQIHLDALRELGESFESDVSPILVEVEGRTLKLTGSVEDQYELWRGLLREYYLSETGFGTDAEYLITPVIR